MRWTRKWLNSHSPNDASAAVYRWDAAITYFNAQISYPIPPLSLTKPILSSDLSYISYHQIECDLVMLANTDPAQISYPIPPLSHTYSILSYPILSSDLSYISYHQIECDLVMLANTDPGTNAQISYLVHDLTIYNPALPRYIPNTLAY